MSYDRLEEPPPPRRTKPLPPPRTSTGLSLAWRRPADEPTESAPREVRRPGRGRGFLLALVALAVVGLQAWTVQRLSRLRNELAVARATLEEARGSLTTLWSTTDRLDRDRMSRLSILSDSIGSVFAYAQGEIQLWQTAYYAQEQQLKDNSAAIARNGDAIARLADALRTANTRLDELAGADEMHGGRLEALEQQDRTHSSLVDALSQRTATQEAAAVDLTTRVAELRETLVELDGVLVGMQDRLAASTSAYGDMDTRVGRIASYIEEFRRAGITGDELDDRLASLDDEIRRLRLRVDSLRPVRTIVSPAAQLR
jgi:chromosome segregation ATPase